MMKRHWILLVAFVLLILACMAAWWSQRRAGVLDVRRVELEAELEEVSARLENAAQEKGGYELLDRRATQVREALSWEPDCTYSLRWFADIAAEEGVRLLNTQMATLRCGEDVVASKKLRRTQFDIRVQGTYTELVRYIGRIECSRQPILVEKVRMQARRNKGREGELRLTVASLCPVDLQPAGVPPSPESAHVEPGGESK